MKLTRVVVEWSARCDYVATFWDEQTWVCLIVMTDLEVVIFANLRCYRVWPDGVEWPYGLAAEMPHALSSSLLCPQGQVVAGAAGDQWW